MPAAARARRSPAPRARAGGAIRWDRVGRFALLAVLLGILALYVGPLTDWREQVATAEVQRSELGALEREHEALLLRVEAMETSSALELEARRLGMVKRGETPLAVEAPGK